MTKQTVVLDFDGVLHSYTSGWKGATIIPDPPVDGAQAFCQALLRDFDVIIVSTRCSQSGGPKAIEQWLLDYYFPFTQGFTLGLQVSQDGVKPPSILTIDDRSWCFTGVWPTIEAIKTFQLWTKLINKPPADGTCY